MKKKILILEMQACLKCIWVCTFCSLYILVRAQKPDLCGSYFVDKAALAKAIAFEKNSFGRLQATPYLLRVYFHICRFDDGSNAGATTADIDNEFDILKRDFAANNICFLNAGLNFINKTALDTINVDTDGGFLPFISYMVAGCINIFYVNKINGKNSATGGGIGGYGLLGIGCLVGKKNVGLAHSISHEVGHFLGLLHTFDDHAGHENIDGSNCAISADLICDTKADPFVFNADNCFAVTGCTYSGNCKDPNGQSNYSPPFTNMMAYWGAVLGEDCFPDLSFSDEQFQRINTFLVIEPSIISCESAENETLAFLTDVSDGNYIKSGIYSLTTSGVINLHGTVRAVLGSQAVHLKSGFHAYPAAGGKVSIKATDCDYTSFRNRIISKSNVQNQISIKNSKLNVYPNPTTSFVNVEFDIASKANNITLQLYDMAGTKVKELRLGYMPAGKQKVQLNLAGLASGVYNLTLCSNKGQVNIKVVLTK